jgi:hypothetical protein
LDWGRPRGYGEKRIESKPAVRDCPQDSDGLDVRKERDGESSLAFEFVAQ